MVVSNMFYFHSENWGGFPTHFDGSHIFLQGVGEPTTNQDFFFGGVDKSNLSASTLLLGMARISQVALQMSLVRDAPGDEDFKSISSSFRNQASRTCKEDQTLFFFGG